MRILKLVLMHAYFEILNLLRQPAFVVSTLIFPAMFFWFFGVPNAQSEGAARLLCGSFSAFALLGVVVFQFGASLAQERGTPWSSMLRILPLPEGVHMSARLISSLFFALLSIGFVLIVGGLTTPAHMPMDMVVRLMGVLIICGIPFGLLGMVIGLSTDANSVLPVANMVYLPLSFAGGLWMPPEVLPKVIQNLSPYLPTRMLGEIVWSVTVSREAPQGALLGLAAYGLVFGVVAFLLYRKDQEKQFS